MPDLIASEGKSASVIPHGKMKRIVFGLKSNIDFARLRRFGKGVPERVGQRLDGKQRDWNGDFPGHVEFDDVDLDCNPSASCPNPFCHLAR
ncbi:MAG: hypothetical protein WDM89_05435 [Rhizomicrobium sp.]